MVRRLACFCDLESLARVPPAGKGNRYKQDKAQYPVICGRCGLLVYVGDAYVSKSKTSLTTLLKVLAEARHLSMRATKVLMG